MPEKSLFYRLGYALERARQGSAAGRERLAGLAERRPDDSDRRTRPKATRRGGDVALPDADTLLLAAATLGATKVLDLWRPRRRAGAFGLVRAAAAGAAAAFLLDLVRPLLRGEEGGIDAGTPDRLLAGAGQGILYGAAVEPRVPGPAPLKGVVYGSVEYAVDPMGGLGRLLGPHAPTRRVPILSDLLDGLAPADRAYLEHLLFGVALATLYGSGTSLNGRRATEEPE